MRIIFPPLLQSIQVLLSMNFVVHTLTIICVFCLRSLLVSGAPEVVTVPYYQPVPVATPVQVPRPVDVYREVPVRVPVAQPYPVRVTVPNEVPVDVPIRRPVPVAVARYHQVAMPRPVSVPVNVPVPVKVPVPSVRFVGHGARRLGLGGFGGAGLGGYGLGGAGGFGGFGGGGFGGFGGGYGSTLGLGARPYGTVNLGTSSALLGTRGLGLGAGATLGSIDGRGGLSDFERTLSYRNGGDGFEYAAYEIGPSGRARELNIDQEQVNGRLAEARTVMDNGGQVNGRDDGAFTQSLWDSPASQIYPLGGGAGLTQGSTAAVFRPGTVRQT